MNKVHENVRYRKSNPEDRIIVRSEDFDAIVIRTDWNPPVIEPKDPE